MQNISGVFVSKAQRPREIAGNGSSFVVPNKLSFAVSWNYITESAKMVRDAADTATSAAEPEAAVASMTAPDSAPHDQKWEMVIPKMSRPPAKPGFPPRPQMLPEPQAVFSIPAFAAPAPSSGLAPVFATLRSEFLRKWRRVPNSALIGVVVAWVFLLIIAFFGGAFR